MISYSHPKLFPSTSTSLYKTILLLLNIVIAAAISVDSVQAQSKDDLQELIRASKTRAALVQNVKQAVVHIKVEKEITNTGRNTPNNPRDLYNDEFFERFFPGMRPPRDQGNDRCSDESKRARQRQGGRRRHVRGRAAARGAEGGHGRSEKQVARGDGDCS